MRTLYLNLNVNTDGNIEMNRIISNSRSIKLTAQTIQHPVGHLVTRNYLAPKILLKTLPAAAWTCTDEPGTRKLRSNALKKRIIVNEHADKLYFSFHNRF